MFARGVLQNPMTADEMWAKYDDCVAMSSTPAVPGSFVARWRVSKRSTGWPT